MKPDASEEDLTDCDTLSVVSTQSDGSGVAAAEGGDEVDESSAQEDFEDKLKEIIDMLTQKRYVVVWLLYIRAVTNIFFETGVQFIL